MRERRVSGRWKRSRFFVLFPATLRFAREVEAALALQSQSGLPFWETKTLNGLRFYRGIISSVPVLLPGQIVSLSPSDRHP